ncbi:MAG TPA: hypothetical protein VLA83_05055, partial [Candidatus Binatia bacterium]|nr:hypothetical protein [Candidatus Binatia bacterium]
MPIMQRFSLTRVSGTLQERGAGMLRSWNSFFFGSCPIYILSQTDPISAPLQGVPEKTNHRAMAMVSTLFFAWGFLTCLNDILIPHLKNIFDLNYTEVMLVQFAFFSSYFLFSMPSGKIVE